MNLISLAAKENPYSRVLGFVICCRTAAGFAGKAKSRLPTAYGNGFRKCRI